MPSTEKLALVPFTPAIHEQVVQLHLTRKMAPPPMPRMAVAAVGRSGSLCASMYLYETDLFLFNEFLCTNPEYPARQRHAAVLLMSHAVVALALAKGLFVMTTPRTKGGEMIAKRMGFKDSGMPMWVRKADPMPLWEAAPEEEIPLGPESVPEESEVAEPEVPDGDSWDRMTDRVAGPEEPPKRRPSPAAKGRHRGKETGEEPARKTLRRVSRRGKSKEEV